LLLDGVNEIKVKSYKKALDRWRNLLAAPGGYYSGTPAVFTSRTGEDPSDSLGVDDALQILDLDDEGVRAFLRAYGSEDAERDFKELGRKNLLGERGLGRNPYWLKMIVESDLYTRNRGVLFEGFARALIKRELDKPVARPHEAIVEMEDEMDALAHLALAMHREGVVGFGGQEVDGLRKAREVIGAWLEKEGLAGKYAPDDVLCEAEGAKLLRINRRDRVVSFEHQLVQEFFAAYALRQKTEEALRRAGDHWWWEALLMLGGLVADHSDFVRKVLGDGSDDERVFLAVGLLRSVEEPEAEVERRVMAALVGSLQRGVTEAHKRAAVELAKLLGDEAVEQLGKLLQEDDLTVREGAVDILGEVGDRKAAEVLVGSLGDGEIAERVQGALVKISRPAVEPLIKALGERSGRREAISDASHSPACIPGVVNPAAL
jgi:hypothetical protein